MTGWSDVTADIRSASTSIQAGEVRALSMPGRQLLCTKHQSSITKHTAEDEADGVEWGGVGWGGVQWGEWDWVEVERAPGKTMTFAFTRSSAISSTS